MKFFKRLFGEEFKLRYTGRITRQEDEDRLKEIMWRHNVQRNIARRRALKLLQGGKL